LVSFSSLSSPFHNPLRLPARMVENDAVSRSGLNG
jgi:hypothetical protein